MARSYKRDKNGRFAGGGGGGGSRGGGSKPIQRGANRLTRDNAGRITSQGGNGATARGGRLATASGNKRATQTAKLSGGGSKGTVGKPKALKPGAIKPKAANAVKASPRQRTEAEAAYLDIKHGKGHSKFNSDAKVRAEMQRRGFLKGSDPQGELINIAHNARAKTGKNNPATSSWVDAGKAKPAAPSAKKPMTKAEYEAAAKKAWGPGWNAKGAKPKRTADQQLDRLASRSRNMQNARTGLTKAEAAKASELSKQTGRRVRVTQNENGSFAVTAAPAHRRGTVGKIDNAKADRIIQRHDAMRPGLRPGTGSKAKAMNSINTFLRARKFLLEPSRKVAKKGETISGQESIRRAVAGASKKARNRK